MKTVELELLRADVMDSGGDVFTPEALQSALKSFRDTPSVGVYSTFEKGADLLATVTALRIEDGRLLATIEFLDNEKGKAAEYLVEARAVELAAGGTVLASKTGFHNGKSLVVEDFRLTSTVLTTTKVK